MKQLSRKKIQDMIDLNGANISSRRSSGGSGAGGGGGVSSAWVDEHYVSKDFFARMFTINGTDENDDDVVVEPNDLETTITNIQAMVGLWTEEYLSALGQGSGGGGGGGALLTEPLASINEAGMGTPSGGNKVIAWNGNTWTYMPYTTGSGTVTSVTMTVPTGFKVSNGDTQTINNSGTFALTFGGTITKNQVLASPAAANGTPAWRALVADDIPTLTAAKISDITLTDGTLTIGNNSITPITDATLKSNYTWWGEKLDSTTGKREGNMSNVGNISFSDTGKNIGSVAYFDTTNHRLGIGSAPGAYKLDVNGDIRTSGNLYIGGTNRILSGSGDSAKNLLEFDGTQVTLAYGFRASNETRIYGQNISMYHGSTLKVQVTSTGLKIGDATLSWDSTNHALKIDTGFYSESFISALGAGSGGGSGALLTEPLASINEAGLGSPSGSNKVIVWTGSAWSYMPYSSGSSGNYLPLTGGTMTGSIEFGTTTSTYHTDIRFYRNGHMSFFAPGSDRLTIAYRHGIDSETSTQYNLVLGDNVFTYNGYAILHAGNSYVTNGKGYINGTEITSISGYLSQSDADNRYLKLTGGTLSNSAWGQQLRLLRQGGTPSLIMSDGTLEFWMYPDTTPSNRWTVGYKANNVDYNATLALTSDIPIIYDWAKAATKPSYSFSEITGTASAAQIPDLSSTYSTVANTVTALGTSGNYLTWTKNGTTSNITVPYSTKAGSLSDTATHSAFGKTFFSSGNPVNIPITASAMMQLAYFTAMDGESIAGYVGRGGSRVNTIFLLGYSGNEVDIGANESTGHIHINTSGNVGIGTLSPAVKLDVNGAMKTTRIYLYKPNAGNDTGAVYFAYDAPNGGVHLYGAGLYADTYVSALGAGSGGGSGSGITMNDVWSALAATAPSSSSEQINVTHMTQALSGYVTLNGMQTISGTKEFYNANIKSNFGAKFGGLRINFNTRELPAEGEINRSSGSGVCIQYDNAYNVDLCHGGGSVRMQDTLYFSKSGTDHTMSAPAKLKVSAGQVYISASTFDGNAPYLGGSDIRLKDVINPVTASVEDIANVRIFDFRWKKDSENGKIYFGSAAQDWQKIFPYAVVADNEGFLSMDYAGIAVGAANAVAKEVVLLKKRVAELEKQLKAS